MNKEELLVVAKELGIENADSLAYNELKKAVSKVKKTQEIENSDTQEIENNPDVKTDVNIENDNIGHNTSQNTETISPSFVVTHSGSNSSPPFTVEIKKYYEDDQARKYVFSSFAPEKFRFNNQIKTKEEWLQDSEAMEQLVFGNSAYVEQIFND